MLVYVKLDEFVQRMPKYIISLQQNQPFPFEGNRQHLSQIIVRKRIKIVSPEEQKQLADNIHLLLTLKTPYVIPITRVLEHRGKYFIIDYQYVPETLNKNSRILTQSTFIPILKDKLFALTQCLVQNSIRTQIKQQDIGISSEGQLKVYLNIRFDVQLDINKKQLINDYQIQVDRLLQPFLGVRGSVKAPSEISDYSYRLDKKISEIEHKLNRRKRRHSKGGSSPQRVNAFHNDQKCSNSGLMESSKLSNGSEKTRNSVIEFIKPRIHKSSFNDFTTTSYKLNEQTREDSLKKRFEKALQKTQQAFKTYGKHFKRNRRL